MTGVGDGLNAKNAVWSFSGDTVKNFDQHVSKSVPLYFEGHKLVCHLSDFFVSTDSIIYEIGCSTGELTLKLAEHNSAKPTARFIGIDIEQDMIDQAKVKQSQGKEDDRVTFLAEDIFDYDLEPCDFVVAYYTAQFIKPKIRQDIFNKVYNALNWGGAFILFEKVRGSDARFQDILSQMYNEYKLDQGYTPDEIIAKSKSLKSNLEPFSTEGNLDLLKRAGFVDINSIMKYICFEGFLAIK